LGRCFDFFLKKHLNSAFSSKRRNFQFVPRERHEKYDSVNRFCFSTRARNEVGQESMKRWMDRCSFGVARLGCPSQLMIKRLVIACIPCLYHSIAKQRSPQSHPIEQVKVTPPPLRPLGGDLLYSERQTGLSAARGRSDSNRMESAMRELSRSAPSLRRRRRTLLIHCRLIELFHSGMQTDNKIK
jgi:hypothetical protein